VPLAFDDGYRLPVGRLAAALTARTRLVSLASPQNPSGVRISETELGDVLDAVREKAPGAVVLVDETYRESTYGRTEPPRSVAALVPQVVTCSSLSKAFGAPGLRIGWLTTTDPTLHAKLRDAKFRTSVSCSTIDEFLGARVLEKRAEILAPRARRLGEALDELLAWADGQPVDIVEPDGGALCCLRLRRGEAAGFYDRLAALETRVGPGSWFGEQDRVFRVGFGHLPAAEFTAALHCLAKAL
jgi:aspartate/methionine/tyrosine aminotransferase